MIHSAYMLNAMWRSIDGECANAAVRKRHGSDRPAYGANAIALVTSGSASCPTNTATQVPMIVSDAIGRPHATAPPNTVRPCRLTACA